MSAILSDGRLVPVGCGRWAAEMRRLLIMLSVKPEFGDVLDLRKLLAFRPVHYMGEGWEQLAAAGRAWLAVYEAAVPVLLLSSAQLAAIADDPLLPAEPARVRMMGAD